MRTRLLAGLTAAALAFSSNANAAQTLIISGPSGNFGDDEVVCGASPTPCSFSRTFTFATPAGFNQVNLDISSLLSSTANDINFSSVTFNGVNFNVITTGMQEFRNLLTQNLRTDGTSNVIAVSGTTGGNSSFRGNINLANNAVPEPGTWGLMLLGFAGIGISLRRRRHSSMIMQIA